MEAGSEGSVSGLLLVNCLWTFGLSPIVIPPLFSFFPLEAPQWGSELLADLSLSLLLFNTTRG